MATGYSALINGTAFDHSSHRVRIDSIVEPRVDEISYAHGVEGITKLHGTSVSPISRTRGQYKPDAPSITLHLQAWIELRARFGAGFMEKVFNIDVEYAETGVSGGFVKDTLVGCKITKVERATSQGGAHAVVKLTLDCMRVEENGVLPMAGMTR